MKQQHNTQWYCNKLYNETTQYMVKQQNNTVESLYIVLLSLYIVFSVYIVVNIHYIVLLIIIKIVLLIHYIFFYVSVHTLKPFHHILYLFRYILLRCFTTNSIHNQSANKICNETGTQYIMKEHIII